MVNVHSINIDQLMNMKDLRALYEVLVSCEQSKDRSVYEDVIERLVYRINDLDADGETYEGKQVVLRMSFELLCNPDAAFSTIALDSLEILESKIVGLHGDPRHDEIRENIAIYRALCYENGWGVEKNLEMMDEAVKACPGDVKSKMFYVKLVIEGRRHHASLNRVHTSLNRV